MTRKPTRKPTRKLTRNTRLSLIIAGVVVVVIGALFAATRLGADPVPGDAAEAAAVAARPDSHRLSAPPGSTVTFVEFLDFECEACGSVYPAIEQLRAEYGDRVTFVIRNFPGPGHVNAEPAARAVEAAARQGRLEPMYAMMFETQAEWGEQGTPLDDRFRGYAQRLGLDLVRFDADYDDPAVLERIRADRADGVALGVQGTPTFFLDGRRLTPRTYEDLTAALDAALAGG